MSAGISSLSEKETNLSFRFFEACFFLTLFLLPVFFGAVYLWSLSSALLILSVSFLFYWVNYIRSGPTGVLRTPLDKAILLYVAAFFISLIFSKVRVLSLVEAFKLCGVLLAYKATTYYCIDRRHMTRLAQFLVLIGATLSLVGLLQFLGGLPREWWAKPYFLSASYVNHNHFAGLLVMLLPVSLGLSVAERDKSKKVLFIFMAILMGVAFIFTLSRGGLLALAVSLIFMLTILKRRRLVQNSALPFLVFLSMVICAVVILGTDPIEKRIENTTQTVTQEEELSLKYRWMTWKGTLPMILDGPIVGSGPGTFGTAFLKHRPAGFNQRPVYAHNDFLHLLAECGLLGFLAGGWLVFLLFQQGWRVVHRDHSRLRGGLGAGLLAALLGLLVHGLFDFNFHIPANWLISAVLAGLLFSMDGRPVAPGSAARRYFHWIAAPLLSVLVILGSIFFGLSAYRYWEADTLIKEKEIEGALDPIQQSLRQNPLDPESYYLRGFIRYQTARSGASENTETMRLAVEDFDKAMALNPLEPVYDLWKARSMAPIYAGDSPSELLDSYHRVLKKDPNNAMLHYMVGKDLLEANKKQHEAIRLDVENIFVRAIQLDPTLAESCYGQMWVYDRTISKMMAFHERTPQGLKGFVKFLEKQDLWKYHRKYYLRSLKLDPDRMKEQLANVAWNEKSPEIYTLSDFVSPARTPVHLDDFFFSSGELSKKIKFRSPRLRLALYAKASAANGTYPVLYVKIDGRIVDELYIDSKTPKNYYCLLEALEGNHRLSLQYVNDWKDKTSAVEDRNVWIPRIEIQEPLGE